MNGIRLLAVENIITRKTEVPQQNLAFLVLVENVGYDKKVDVVWAGEDGVWHTLPAEYHGQAGQDKEYWRARASFPLTADKALPGNITFALRLQAWGAEHWDNNSGRNHCSEADSGIEVAHGAPLLNICHGEGLQEDQRLLPITVAVDKTLEADKVTVHWTTDNWKNVFHTDCHFKKNFWDKAASSNARNPNQYGSQIWGGALKLYNAFRVDYCVSCEYKGQKLWDNNFGRNYSLRRKQLKVLILNLHCYQEEDQDQKFSQIARAIDELNVDIVCLQEVAELWNDGKGDWETNSARIINERLKTPYHLHTDWSHLGFDKYREGVAILSRYPIVKHKSRYVSPSHDPYDIHSRKVVMAQIRLPYMGLLNVFSSHLSWWDDGFDEQFENLRKWVADEHSGQVKGAMLCGDFNIKAGSKGYRLVVNSKEFEDQFLAVNAPEAFGKIFKDKRPDWHLLDADHRIDYIFMHKDSALRVTSGEEMFTERDSYGRVSDHTGYLMSFEPK